jgi:hypothetical protein
MVSIHPYLGYSIGTSKLFYASVVISHICLLLGLANTEDQHGEGRVRIQAIFKN